MTPLNKFVCDHYGSQKQFAQHLNVAEHTVSRWIKRKPEYLMRHAVALTREKPTNQRKKFIVEMVTAISSQLDLIQEN